MRRKIRLLAVSVVIGITGCSAPSAISERTEIRAPQNWQQSNDNLSSANEQIKVLNQWVTAFNDEDLIALVKEALDKNYKLKVESLQLDLAKQNLIITGADQYPELTLGQSNSRRKTVNSTNSQYQSNAEINLQLSYELDVWGKLSAKQKQARLNYQAAKLTYQQHQLELMSQVSQAWYNIVEAQQLLLLFQERADNLMNNLAMIQSSYRLGLNDALDVYLTQNELSREQARLAEQKQVLLSRKRALELLIGSYPSGTLTSQQKLPMLNSTIAVGLPAQLLARRADISASWMQLLALDAGLAVAHKQRFPKISLTASTGDSSTEVSQLLRGSSLAWSLIGNITMPLFDAGRLASLEEQARLKVIQKEQEYLSQVYQAFSDVENALSNHAQLSHRFRYIKQADENAKAAEKLSFDKYIRGLVSYTTVLEAQRRAFDAETSLVQLQNQLIKNRISLHVSLGAYPTLIGGKIPTSNLINLNTMPSE